MADELTVSECGVSKDMTLCMMARLRRGANPPSQRVTALGGAGQWFCVACQFGGCYAIRTWCYRYGLSRQESEQAMSGSSPSSWPLPPGPVHNRRQPRHVPPGETLYPARPPSGPNFSTAPTFRTPRNKGNKQPNPGASVQIQQSVEMLAATRLQLGGHDNRVSGLASPEILLRKGSGGWETCWTDKVGPNRILPILKGCVTG